MKSFKIFGGGLFLIALALAMIKLGGAYAVEDTNSDPPVANNQSEFVEPEPEADGTLEIDSSDLDTDLDSGEEPQQPMASTTFEISTDFESNSSEEATNDSEAPEGVVEVGSIQQQLTDLENQGAVPDEQVSRALRVHLTAIAQFEKQGSSDKVVKHMKGFMQLLNYHKEEGLLSEEAYQTLKDEAQAMIDQHH